MFALALRNIGAHRRRLLSTGIAVVLGVAFLMATVVLGDTMRRSFRDVFDETTARTDVIVRNENVFASEPLPIRGPVDDDLIDRLVMVDGVAAAAGRIEGPLEIIDGEGDRIGGGGPPVIAGNWIDDPELNPLSLRGGRAPTGAGEMVIDVAAAKRSGLAEGDVVTILTPARRDVRIVGTTTLGDREATGGATFVALDAGTAAGALADPGEVSSVLLRAEPGVEPNALRDRIAAELGPDLEALTGTELSAELQADIEADFLGMVETALLGFAGIALLVAAFGIHNTFSIIAAQRTRESALLRSLGASRRQVIAAHSIEALAVGAVASAIGIAAGIGLALGAKDLMARGGMALGGSGVVVDTSGLLIAFVAGVGLTFLASVIPAIRSSRVDPIAAMREVSVDRSDTSRTRAIGGAAVAAVGAAAVIAGALDGSAGAAGIGALLTVLGAVVSGPAIARPATMALGAPLELAGGTTGRIAGRNAARNPRRTAGSASALLIGVAIVVLMATIGASLKSSIDRVVERSFAGDLVLNPGWGSVGLAPELASEVAALDEVDAIAPLTEAAIRMEGGHPAPLATDTSTLGSIIDLDVVEGSLSDVGPDEVASSRRHADATGLRLGDSIAGTALDGSSIELTVAAIYRDRDLIGDMIMSEEGRPGGGALDMVLIDLADGVDLEAGTAAVQVVSERHGGPTPLDRDGYVAEIGAEIDQLLGLVYGLLGLSVLIALMGISNSMSLAVHERTREIGLLRAVGQTRRQAKATVRWESVITAAFGTVTGIGLGTFLGWGLFEAVGSAEGLHEFTVPTGMLATLAIGALIAGVLAAVRPSRRAARMDILDAISAP